MLRIGLVGTGDAGKHHARALATATELAWTVVGARDVAATKARRAELGLRDATRTIPTADALAGDACDAVVLATPDGLHHAHAMRALAAGKHVLVEKPIALTAAEAGELAAVAAANDRVLQVGYHLRHHAGHVAIRARLAELVGPVRAVSARWAWPDPATTGWRANGDRARWWSLAALGTHAIDLALWFADAEVTRVVGLCEPPDGIDRAAEVTLRFATGALAHVSCAITHRSPTGLTIEGETGTVACVGTLGARGAGAIAWTTKAGTVDLPFAVEDPYLRQLRAFAARCAGGGPRVDRDAIHNLTILELIR